MIARYATARHRIMERIVLTKDERRDITAWKRRYDRLKKAALGVEVVRATAQGKTASQIARALRTTRATVGRWQRQFLKHGLAAVIADPARRGRVHPTPLEKKIGYSFRDRELLETALTHRSYVNERRLTRNDSNERLEYLGDAVLNLAVSHELVAAHPEAAEGDLSRLRASLVNEAALAELAAAIGLGGHLRLGRGEELTGGREKPSILSDAFEALVGAVYLDGGFDSAVGLVRARFRPRFGGPREGAVDRDFKTRVQEIAQDLFKEAPSYRVADESGPDHRKVFEVECLVGGQVYGRGTGRSKKEAAQHAAEAAVAQLNALGHAADSIPPH